ncbi:EamA family transporter [Fodinicola acaciae]|uniref:EamA family transporter n=1 Tax=Fodinicola acaciae TaxID=2681555 RepID=UPI0013D458E8|nr:EamA family transporter [Fodinicola acaciae]
MDRKTSGIALMLGSGFANQLGAATGALAFPVIGPAGVVAVRQLIAAAVLLSVGRPRFRSYGWRQWWPILLLAAVFATMNLSLYTAIDRIGLGLAVTLEFLGPLTVAVLMSRRALDIGCAIAAGAGVVWLTRPQPSTDHVGIGLALLAALCWASYILLNRTVGRRVVGVEGSATAAGISAMFFVPVAVVIVIHDRPSVGTLAYAAVAGILSSVVPFLADLYALRRVPAHFFGLFMSISPIFAALVGLVVLGQSLGWSDWLAIAVIIAANAVASGSKRVADRQVLETADERRGDALSRTG